MTDINYGKLYKKLSNMNRNFHQTRALNKKQQDMAIQIAKNWDKYKNDYRELKIGKTTEAHNFFREFISVFRYTELPDNKKVHSVQAQVLPKAYIHRLLYPTRKIIYLAPLRLAISKAMSRGTTSLYSEKRIQKMIIGFQKGGGKFIK